MLVSGTRRCTSARTTIPTASGMDTFLSRHGRVKPSGLSNHITVLYRQSWTRLKDAVRRFRQDS